MKSQGHGFSTVSGPVNFTVFHGHVLQLQTQELPARVSCRRRRAPARGVGGPLPIRRHCWRSTSEARPALAWSAAWCFLGNLLIGNDGPSAVGKALGETPEHSSSGCLSVLTVESSFI